MKFWRWIKKIFSLKCSQTKIEKDNVSVNSMYSQKSQIVRPLDNFLADRMSAT